MGQFASQTLVLQRGLPGPAILTVQGSGSSKRKSHSDLLQVLYKSPEHHSVDMELRLSQKHVGSHPKFYKLLQCVRRCSMTPGLPATLLIPIRTHRAF